jgi:uncharacterized protein YndB with AHSA1/START domain
MPVHRLAYSFGWDGNDEMPPGSSLVKIDLIDRDGGTLLRVTHGGLPNAVQCANHDRGLAHYLPAGDRRGGRASRLRLWSRPRDT